MIQRVSMVLQGGGAVATDLAREERDELMELIDPDRPVQDRPSEGKKLVRASAHRRQRARRAEREDGQEDLGREQRREGSRV